MDSLVLICIAIILGSSCLILLLSLRFYLKVKKIKKKIKNAWFVNEVLEDNKTYLILKTQKGDEQFFSELDTNLPLEKQDAIRLKAELEANKLNLLL